MLTQCEKEILSTIKIAKAPDEIAGICIGMSEERLKGHLKKINIEETERKSPSIYGNNTVQISAKFKKLKIANNYFLYNGKISITLVNNMVDIIHLEKGYITHNNSIGAKQNDLIKIVNVFRKKYGIKLNDNSRYSGKLFLEAFGTLIDCECNNSGIKANFPVVTFQVKLDYNTIMCCITSSLHNCLNCNYVKISEHHYE